VRKQFAVTHHIREAKSVTSWQTVTFASVRLNEKCFIEYFTER
jgi:hypothetical protein